ncbi:MAG: Hsp20/alpha crystallin family protein [Candidatus Diapherotrites archaeon]|nr:Hsp20/alpha crystallin family protein [Candidatus Diapherotrites archaeon]
MPANANQARKERDFSRFERLEELMDELMQELMEVEGFEALDGRNPVLFGFSMRFDADGRPRIEEFGNVKPRVGAPLGIPTGGQSGARQEGGAWQPLVDVNRQGEQATISVELPGIRREDLKVRVAKSAVTVQVEGDTPYYKEIEFGERIAAGSVKALYKNGILEIGLKTEHPTRNGKAVRVH